MRNWALSLFASLLLVAPAAATPPHVVWVTDRLFAASSGELLILRVIGDNHGSHFTTQTDTFLLTVSAVDGQLVDVAPVERVVDINLGEPDLDSVTYYPVDGAVNPYAVRADAMAAPRDDPTYPSAGSTTLTPTSLMVLEEDAVTHSLSLPALRSQIMTSLTQTRAVLPVLYQPVGYEGDPFEPQSLNLLRDCVPDATVRPWVLDETPSAFVRLTCEDWDIGAQWTLWVVVPAAN